MVIGEAGDECAPVFAVEERRAWHGCWQHDGFFRADEGVPDSWGSGVHTHLAGLVPAVQTASTCCVAFAHRSSRGGHPSSDRR